MSLRLLTRAARRLAVACLAAAAPASAADPPAGSAVLIGIDRDFAPYEFLDEHGAAAGFDVDLVRAAAARAGLTARFVPGTREELRRALAEGRVQALAGTLRTQDEVKDSTTVLSYAQVDYVAFVREGARPVAFMQDLVGRDVLVRRGGNAAAILEGRGLPFTLVPVDSAEDALRRVAGDANSCALLTRTSGLLAAGRIKLARIDGSGPPIISRELCFEVGEGGTALLARMREGVAALKASGRLDHLQKQWFALLAPRRGTLVWIFRHAALLLVPLLTLAAAFAMWSWTLSRRVEKHTAQLRAELAERRRVETALRESESRFRALADTVPFGIMIVQGGSLVYANHALEGILGYTLEELRGASPWDLLAPSDSDRLQARFTKMLEASDPGPETCEVKVATKEGHERWIECSVAPASFEGEPAVVAAVSDSTDRRRSQEIQAAMYEISQSAHAAGSLGELYASIHRIVGRLMAATNFYIALYDPETDLLSFPYFVDEEDERPAPLPPGRGMTGYVLRTGKPLLATADAVSRLEQAGDLQSLGAPSLDWLGVPLTVRETTIGVLAVQSYSGVVRYGEAERDILSYVSTQVAQAIERKRAEQELRESQRKLLTLTSNLPGMAYRCANDEHWTMEFVSEGCLSLTGYHPADLVANRRVSYEELIDPADRQGVRNAVNEALTSRRAFEFTYRIRTANGSQKWVWERGSGVFVPEGPLLALEGFIADISERRRAEEALRQSEERYRLALQATQEIMYDWDVPNDALFWNPNLTSVLGYQPAEMASLEAVLTHVHHEDAARVRRELAAAVASGEVFSTEYRLRRRSGEFAVLLNRGLIIRAGDGSAVRMVGAISDLTASKQLQDQLRQAQKIEAVGRLAGGIAHDFNNLLTALLGSTELLQRRLSGDHLAQQELSTIHRTARRAADFTQGLLAFARRQVLEPVNLDLNGFVSESLPMLRRMIPENIRIDFRAHDGLPAVRADRGQLTQILMNLCANARDAMPGGGTLTVSTSAIAADAAFLETHPGSRPGRYVELVVADDGAGIPPQDLDHIFEPFFTTKERGKGSGLGLSTVYGIVKQHGGYIYAASAAGSGSAFSVYLPAATGPGETVELAAEGTTRGGCETVLVVEDEPEVRQILMQALSGYGYRVFEAGDGVDALSLLRSKDGNIELVLTDVVMPRMGGMELFQAARAISPSIRFLFSSGYTEDSVHVGFVKKEGIFFLAKPYGIDTLARKVREVLDSNRPASDA
jgi:PAS domain S-box-containing protein